MWQVTHKQILIKYFPNLSIERQHVLLNYICYCNKSNTIVSVILLLEMVQFILVITSLG